MEISVVKRWYGVRAVTRIRPVFTWHVPCLRVDRALGAVLLCA